MKQKIVHILVAIGIYLWHPAGAISQTENDDRCLVAPKPDVALSKTPSSVWGLVPKISRPAEGRIALHPDSSVGHVILSPVGDFTSSAGPFDPVNQRLYLWAFFSSGWVEVTEVAGVWLFSDAGIIEPKLYHPAHDTEDVTLVRRSEALEAQFYSGFTEPHWLSGGQSYQVHMIKGETISRISELEARGLRYVGDDPIARLAVFIPQDVTWKKNANELVWFNGETIVDPPEGLETPKVWCRTSN